MIQKRTALFLACILLISVLLPCGGLAADKKETVSRSLTDKYNIMLLIDKSGSMNETDQQGLARSAACQFADQMSVVSGMLADSSAVTGVGVMSFAKEAELIAPVMPMDSPSNVAYLKKQINGIVYQKTNSGGTDLSVAVNEALRQLKAASAPTDKKMVVLFTDGYSEYVNSAEASAEALQSAFRLAEELSCEVFVVGLNYMGRIREEGQQEIYRMADTTQLGEGVSERAANDASAVGKQVNYLITDDIGAVREFYGRIYANMISSDLVYIENHEFTVDSQGIMEADITVYGQTKVEAVQITDPDGLSKSRADGDYFEEGDDYYRVIKIVNPKVGTWKVDVVSKHDDYKSYVVQFYGMEASAEAEAFYLADVPECGLKTPQVGKVTVHPLYKGEPYMDSILTNGNTKASFTVSQNGKTESYALGYESGLFTGWFPAEPGSCSIEVRITNALMDRSIPCSLTVTVPPARSGSIGPYSVKKDKELVIEYGVEPRAAALPILQQRIEIQGDDPVFSLREENGKLILTGLRTGTGSFTVIAEDAYGVCCTLTAEAEVKFHFDWRYLVPVIVLASLVCVFMYKRRRLSGRFTVRVEVTDFSSPYRGAYAENSFSAPASYPLSLKKLTDHVITDIRSHSDTMTPGQQSIPDYLQSAGRKLEKRHFVIVKVRELSEETGKGRIVKTYKFRGETGSLRSLAEAADCFENDELRITVSFTREL